RRGVGRFRRRGLLRRRARCGWGRSSGPPGPRSRPASPHSSPSRRVCEPSPLRTRHDGVMGGASTRRTSRLGEGLDLADLMERTGVPAATLHYWLRRGLLPAPERVAANRFAYDERHVQAAQLIHLLREERRMSLDDIAAVLPSLLAAASEEAFRPAMWDALIASQERHLRPVAPPPELISAAREVFAERGYAFVSVDDLCAA